MVTTIDFNADDEWTFSDNRIKNYKPVDNAHTPQRTKLPFYQKDFGWKKNFIAKMESIARE